MKQKPRGPRPLLIIFALAFLLETWIWDSLLAAVRWIAGRIPWENIKRAAKHIINRLPAIVAVLLFGVPVVVMELGSFFSVVAIALGHVILGSICYATLKLLGVSLIAVIYELTREKLMTLPWFVWLHGKFETFHAFARALVAPYRDAAKAYLEQWRRRAIETVRRWRVRPSALSERAQADDSGAFAPGPEFD